MSSPEKLHAEQLIIASNRGPIEYHLEQDNTLTSHPGPGGLVTALSQAAHLMQATWISMALTEGDRLAQQRAEAQHSRLIPSPLYDHKMHLRFVAIPEDTFTQYYGRITTELLWFTFGHLYDLARATISEAEMADAWTHGYCVANQAIADAICAEITQQGTKTVIMLQDFFLALVSSLIRKRYPAVLLQQFLHWPWPDVRYFYLLPDYITRAIIEGLLGNDLLGFQTSRDMHNFLDSAQTMLNDVVVDPAQGVVKWHDHQTFVRTYPVTISVTEEQHIAQSSQGQQEVAKISHLLQKQVIMRVDRVDPVKNIVGGFHAYRQLLDEHPELRGEVVFLALLVPTREQSPVYQRYRSEVFETIEHINRLYGSPDWTPIHAFYGNNRTRALAALQFYDVLLINTMIDGMNLVAKEAAVVNRRDGVLVLSPTAGVFSQLAGACISISPTNTGEIARALYNALTLPPHERQRMARQARASIERYDLHKWMNQQILDLNRLIAE